MSPMTSPSPKTEAGTHTPLPWCVWPGSPGYIRDSTRDGWGIFNGHHRNSREVDANVALTLHAVHSHTELVAALADAIRIIDNTNRAKSDSDFMSEHPDQLRVQALRNVLSRATLGASS